MAVTTAPVSFSACTRPVQLGPNWFAVVMGTGIVANAAVTLPVRSVVLEDAARLVWVLAASLLGVLVGATAVHLARRPGVARAYLVHPVLGHFYGAPPMALMTVGAGAVLLEVPGAGVLDAALWSVGTLLGIVTLVAVPRVHRRLGGPVFGGRLMPVVPPMVSAATGPLLASYLPAGLPRAALLTCCLALFSVAAVASGPVVVAVVRQVVRHGAGETSLAPTTWIVLGPLGQSVTAAHAIGATAGAPGRVLSIVYGVPVWLLAMSWLVVAVVVTARTARGGLPFAMTWWSFTFPLGTVVTGTSALAGVTHVAVLAVVAGLLYAALVAAWVLVAARTAYGVVQGSLLRPA